MGTREADGMGAWDNWRRALRGAESFAETCLCCILIPLGVGGRGHICMASTWPDLRGEGSGTGRLGSGLYVQICCVDGSLDVTGISNF
jgi:hypothetical protein